MKKFAIIVVTLGMVVAFALTVADRSPEADAGAVLACKDFRQLVVETAAGTVSSIELHVRMNKIYEDAARSADSGIKGGASTISSLTPASDVIAAKAAFIKLSAACTNLGH